MELSMPNKRACSGVRVLQLLSTFRTLNSISHMTKTIQMSFNVKRMGRTVGRLLVEYSLLEAVGPGAFCCILDQNGEQCIKCGPVL